MVCEFEWYFRMCTVGYIGLVLNLEWYFRIGLVGHFGLALEINWYVSHCVKGYSN